MEKEIKSTEKETIEIMGKVVPLKKDGTPNLVHLPKHIREIVKDYSNKKKLEKKKLEKEEIINILKGLEK
ncbi:hypothetical protein ACFSQP_02825 [Bizionia sediminis]|uniref:Uncharacterized protein n=1 Tax=Bizionia sediminis TaxID=1737064 RepID=A0ABW5KQ37_9FLAO